MNEQDWNDRDALIASYLSDDPDFAKQLVEKALMSTLAEMYVQGVSTRKVTKLAESLCGHAFSYGSISMSLTSLNVPLLAT